MIILAIIGILVVIVTLTALIGTVVFDRQIDKYGVFEYEKRLPKLIRKIFNLVY